ncbi:hypothetical protein CNMCM5793_001623 [Aspergillus hiratsukae]|uniref:HNH nuclease domain-containing protein n=1 Tax=Aspergillus hiratsukae TaxID=1194566 RepID=A0A8H6PC54_9EURO|nr:hypothetical protein CNMCM5793_001623 [Aspergillus hiratsukae]KAF7165152.1 hypothetical protein CNMCM6106_001392 [Aspergillus hiratsukae]
MASSRTPDAAFKEPRRIELMRQIVRGLTTVIYEADEIDRNVVAVRQFFLTLREFWSGEKVDEWYNAIYEDALGPEEPENLILLSPNTYALYTKGYIAFEPVDRDPEGKWLTLKFWWLKREAYEGDIDFSTIPQFQSYIHPSDYGFALHDVRTDRALLSGETITLKTHDPENCPLPDPWILEMQWFLNRVSVFAGTADQRQLEADEDERDEDSAEELS